MRHGEAEERAATGDSARALTQRGIDDCCGLVETLAAGGATWDVIISSSARRARESAEYMAGGIATPPELDIREELNLAGTDTLLAALCSLPDEVSSVLMVAHNPGVHSLVVLLAGKSGSKLVRRAARDFPPGALARFVFEGESWTDLAPGAVGLRDLFIPRDMG